jgi:hypothetical protein
MRTRKSPVCTGWLFRFGRQQVVPFFPVLPNQGYPFFILLHMYHLSLSLLCHLDFTEKLPVVWNFAPVMVQSLLLSTNSQVGWSGTVYDMQSVGAPLESGEGYLLSWGSSWLTSVPPANLRNITLTQATAVSFHIISNSVFKAVLLSCATCR